MNAKLLGVLLGGFAMCSMSHAALIQIDDLTDTINVYVNNAPIDEALLVRVGESVVFTFTSSLAVAQGSGGVFYRRFLDPANDVDAGQLSDFISLTLTPGSADIVVQFGSDPNLFVVPPSGIDLGTLDETGDYQTVAQYFNLGTGQVIDTYQVRSDVEQAPEPGSLMLLGAGVAGLGLLSRRKRAA